MKIITLFSAGCQKRSFQSIDVHRIELTIFEMVFVLLSAVPATERHLVLCWFCVCGLRAKPEVLRNHLWAGLVPGNNIIPAVTTGACAKSSSFSTWDP